MRSSAALRASRDFRLKRFSSSCQWTTCTLPSCSTSIMGLLPPIRRPEGRRYTTMPGDGAPRTPVTSRLVRVRRDRRQSAAMGQEHRHTAVPNRPSPRPETCRGPRRPVVRRRAVRFAVGAAAALLPLAMGGCKGNDGDSAKDAGTTTAPPDTAPVLTPPTVSPTVLPANAEFCGKMAELISRVIAPKEGDDDFRGPWLEVAKFAPETLKK